MKNLFYSIVILVVSFNYGFCQDAGMRVHIGTSSLINQDPIANPKGTSHSGYHIGVDGRITSGKTAFLVGLRYTSVSKLPNKDFDISGGTNKMTLMNGRVGLDYAIISFGQYLRLRTKALASFDISLNVDREGNLPPGYVFNDGWLGAVTGLGVDLGPATLDLEFELGLLNAYNQKKSATFNSWTLSAGFFF